MLNSATAPDDSRRTDSGLDIDALKIVADGINALREPARATILVTHYQRLLDYVQPDYVTCWPAAASSRAAGPELAKELEARGYEWFGGRA